MNLLPRPSLLIALTALFMASVFCSCFTGVESTPKITARDIKKQKITESPEKRFLADIAAQPTSAWTPGKRFFVTDPRIALIFDRNTTISGDSLCGTELTLAAIRKATSVVGDSQTVLDFATSRGDTLSYRTNITPEAFASRDISLAVPFTVEVSLIDSVRSRMVGNTYYVLPQRRINDAQRDTLGLRYVPVTITAVSAGDAYYPLRISFRDASGTGAQLMMTVGKNPTSTRNFETLFAFSNPRDQYPQISDENWALIQQSRIAEGMTPLECRLALGSPNDWSQRPSTAGMVERWSYSDGVYLIFIDGTLSQFRK